MKNFKEVLKDLNACTGAREWAGDKAIKQVVADCHRGDWLLWLAQRVGVDIMPLTLAKGHCANTVRHLMKNERSIKAVDVAIAFGEGKASRKELDAAAADDVANFDSAADFAAYDAAYAAADANAADAAADAAYAAAYATAADAADFDAYAADADADADAAYATAYATAYAAEADANRMLTADICRKYIGELIVEKVKQLQTLKTTK